MRRKKQRIALATVAVVTLAAGAGGWLVLRDGDTAAAGVQPTTATVATSTLRSTVTSSGTLAAAESAEESFAVSGTVTEVLVVPGDVVAVGQTLAVVDDTILQASLDAAASALDAAEAAEDEGGSDLQVAAAASQVTSAEAALAAAGEAVEDATLRATVAGTVTAVDLEVGDTVGSGTSSGGAGSSTAGSSPAGGTSATTTTDSSAGAISIVSTGRFVVDATVSADDVGQVTPGLQVELSAADVTDTVYGTVAEVAVLPTVDDSGAATFPVTVEVTGTRDDLYAGVSVDLAIVVSQRDDVLTVSSAAVQTDDDGATYVERVTATDDDGEPTATERVDIEIGEVSGTETEVVDGLAEGDVVEVPGVTLPAGDGVGGDGGMGGAGGMGGMSGEAPGGEMPDFSQMPGTDR